MNPSTVGGAPRPVEVLRPSACEMRLRQWARDNHRSFQTVELSGVPARFRTVGWEAIVQAECARIDEAMMSPDVSENP